MSTESITSRIQADLDRGDFGMARTRLNSYLSTTGYNPELLTRLGQISFDMHDPYDAGRYWLTSDAQGPDIEQAIEVFVRRAAGNPHQIATQLPSYARLRTFEGYAPIAQSRLRSLHVDKVLAKWRWTEPTSHRLGKFADKLIGLGCIVVFVALIVIMVTGLYAVGSWVSTLWR